MRVVVLRGQGRAFSAGLDRQMFTPEGVEGVPGILALANGSADESTARIAAWQRAFDWQSRPGIVSIAAVQGHAIGGGFQLALGTDIRIVADDVRFSMKEPAPGHRSRPRRHEAAGRPRRLFARGLEICLTARTVGADESLRIGLASQVVPADGLDAAVDQLVAALLAVDRDAAAETKALLAGGRP